MISFYPSRKKYECSPTSLNSFKHRLRKIIVFPSTEEIIISYSKSTKKINFMTLEETNKLHLNDQRIKEPEFEENMMKVNDILTKSLNKNKRTEENDEIANFYKQRENFLNEMQKESESEFYSDEISFLTEPKLEGFEESEKFDNEFFDQTHYFESKDVSICKQENLEDKDDSFYSEETVCNFKQEELMNRL